MEEHIPVLLDEVLEGLDIKEDGIYCDLTLGRAGHSVEILKRIPKGLLIGLDQDEVALISSKDRLLEVCDNFKLVKDNFENIKSVLESLKIKEIDGCLMDLGVSSPQFDTPNRGFSYRFDARLDMRMDQEQDLDAYKVVNTYEVNTLSKIFTYYGDEKYAYQIAKNIVKKREIKPIETTFELVDIIKASMPAKELRKKGHPAKQVFQALRIEVNNEYEVLEKALKDIVTLLKVGGRLAVITFHSGEDRIVKNFFRSLTSVEYSRFTPISLGKLDEVQFKLVNKKVILAGTKEMEANPRSESAKLRIIERI